MKALTICEPYASAIMAGIKKVENRDWPTSYRGVLVIHAGKSRAYLDSYDGRQQEAMEEGGFHFDWTGKLDTTALPFGMILGTATIVDCIPFAQYEERFPNDPWAFGEFCWIFENPILLPKPILYKGALGLWTLPDSVQLPQMLSRVERTTL